MPPSSQKKVALLVTCLVDLFRPRVAAAAVRLLERAGFAVGIPAQGCCGQVNLNAGDRDGAARMARQIIRTFSRYEHVVAPSGSCVATVRHQYPALFAEASAERAAAEALAGRTWELTSFLHDVAGVRDCDVGLDATATYHDACSGLRELGVRDQPRALLGPVRGLSLTELAQPEECCGFGGLFAMKYPEISARIADQKCAAVLGTGAQCLIGGELGCLMHLEGRLHRLGHQVEVLHVAEVLAGMTGDRADQ